MTDRTLITAFGPFGGFDRNPSAELARRLAEQGRRTVVLEVAYAAVDEFLEAMDQTAFDRLLMTGATGRSDCIRLERAARNRIGTLADVRGAVRGPAAIEPAAGDVLWGTLWTQDAMLAIPRCAWSDDAGDYLCNYAYWRALRRLPTKRVGFVHVPAFDHIGAEDQLAAVRRVLDHLESPL